MDKKKQKTKRVQNRLTRANWCAVLQWRWWWWSRIMIWKVEYQKFVVYNNNNNNKMWMCCVVVGTVLSSFDSTCWFYEMRSYAVRCVVVPFLAVYRDEDFFYFCVYFKYDQIILCQNGMEFFFLVEYSLHLIYIPDVDEQQHKDWY